VDERKKSIRDLDEKRQETLGNLNKLRKNWGEVLLSRLDGEDSDRFADELGQRRHFLETIAAFRDRIQALEDGSLRLRDLEKNLREKEKTAAERTGALKELYRGLGELALQNDPTIEIEASLKTQAEDLNARIGARQGRIGELEEGKNSGVFSRIGNAARGALLRSQLSKDQAGLNRIHESVGEQFFAVLEEQNESGTGDIPPRIRDLRQELSLLEEARASLRNEMETLKDSLGIEKNSRNFSVAKKIREQEQSIALEEEQLSELYRAFGERVCALFAHNEASEEAAWLLEGDRTALAAAQEMEERMAGHEAAMAKLRASLRIDEEREAINKMEGTILNHRRRIAASEEAIADLEKKIAEANQRIAELTQ
jgi:regulator of replication initiation timing